MCRYQLAHLTFRRREVRSVEDISSGYSSSEFLPAESALAAAVDNVQRRTNAGRSKASRPVSVLDGVSTRSTRSAASSTNDVSRALLTWLIE